MRSKSVLFTAIALLFATMIAIFIPTEAEGALYDDTIRLHIIAESDTKEDQELKLKIRDALLLEYSEILRLGESKEDAELILSYHLTGIKEFCEGKIRELGYNYEVEAVLDSEWYDTREYDDITLPRGIYTSLKIIIGKGEGKNWWCVMYPPLCLDLAKENAPSDDGIGKYTDDEKSLIKGSKYNVKFKLLELFSSAFS